MSRCTDLRGPGALRADRDAGFGLIEVVVAFGIVVLVVMALMPQLAAGVRSTETSRLVTQAKGIAQGQIERMRNLPYHVAPEAGDYLDVLDYYYRDRQAPKGTVTCRTGSTYTMPTEHAAYTPAPGQPREPWSGYVSGTATRCPYEPAAPFYRYVVPHPASGDPNPGFDIVVDTQFLSGPGADGASTVQAPTDADYNTQVSTHDAPVTNQIGVTVTVLYRRDGRVHAVTTYSQIANHATTPTRVLVSGSATAAEVGSATTDGVSMSLQVGLLSMEGSLSSVGSATGTAAAATAGLSTSSQADGTSASVHDPAAAGSTVAAPGGIGGSCSLTSAACWGSGSVSWGKVFVDDATAALTAAPTVGSPTSPLEARITDTTNDGFSFRSTSGALRTAEEDLELDPDKPLVWIDSATPAPSGVTATCRRGTGGSLYAGSAGYLTTSQAPTAATPPTTTTVESCVVSSTTTIGMLATTFAPHGVLQVRLEDAYARCQVAGYAHTAAAPAFGYSATVSVWDPESTSYSTLATVTPGSGPGTLPGPDAMAEIVVGPDRTPPAPDPVETTTDPPTDGSTDPASGDPTDTATEPPPAPEPVPGPTLADYIASWSVLDTSTLDQSSANGLSSVSIPGVLKLVTQPVRFDDHSAVSLTLGKLACTALDAR